MKTFIIAALFSMLIALRVWYGHEYKKAVLRTEEAQTIARRSEEMTKRALTNADAWQANYDELWAHYQRLERDYMPAMAVSRELANTGASNLMWAVYCERGGNWAMGLWVGTNFEAFRISKPESLVNIMPR